MMRFLRIMRARRWRREAQVQGLPLDGITVTSKGRILSHDGLGISFDDAALERLRAATSTRFRPGQSGNPAGRPKGLGQNITEARRIAARVYREAFDGRPLQERAAAIAAEIEAGARDDSPEVISVLAGLKRGRELERRGKGKGGATCLLCGASSSNIADMVHGPTCPNRGIAVAKLAVS